MNLQDAQERAAQAGEYVLGTLTPSERSTFETQLRDDRALQAEVYAWLAQWRWAVQRGALWPTP